MKSILKSSVNTNFKDLSPPCETEDVKEETEDSAYDLHENESWSIIEEEKKGHRQTEMYNIIDILRYYAKLGNKRKVNYFKTRKIDVAAYRFKRPTNARPTEQRTLKTNENLHNAELEMATITGLREMYFKTPKIFKTIGESPTEKEPKDEKLQEIKLPTKLIPDNKVCKRYLSKYKQKLLDKLFIKIPRTGDMKSKPKYDEKYAKIKKSRDAIRNGYVVSVFNIDDDDLFTDKELYKIHRMKDNKHSYGSYDKHGHTKNVMHSKEIWEWDEVVNNFPNFSETKKSSETLFLSPVKGNTPIPKPKPEQLIKHYLVNWFKRESPTEEGKDPLHRFQFLGNRYPRHYNFLTKESRLNAAIKFIKFAKAVHPDLECMKILSELESYIGPITLDALQANTTTMGTQLKRPNKQLRYFRKLLEEIKELGNMFSSPEKTTVDLKDKSTKPDEITEEHFKNSLQHSNMSYVHHKYVESRLPSPLNKMFISMAHSLVKYMVDISTDPKAKRYKKEISKLVTKLLLLVLESMNWVIETIFRIASPSDILEDSKTEKETIMDDIGEDRTHEIPTDRIDQTIKTLMVSILKFMNFNSLFYKDGPDTNSTECQSLSSISNEKEKNR
ncbi:unnamed protein product [Nezara viridula]|uniref:Uncharacterized protein n=1 Tax=Nezara viridula TaxID=85310 RepID=A0A9P0H565_NEZVI|nr:unnamed protein product [Nezara viridula]